MLYGRGDELEVLTRLVDDARRGRAGTTVVRGEPGVGKSTLLDALASRAGDIRVLRTRGVESEAGFAFGNLHDLLRPALSRIHRLPPGQAAAMGTAFGLEKGAVTEPLLISVGALSLIAELAEETPTVCLVDDVHWLDHSSAAALGFVARRLEAERVALVFTVRDHEPSHFLATGIPELRLAGLDETASLELLSATFPDVSSRVAKRLFENTLGNPLALLEIAGRLTRAQLQGSAHLPDQLPTVDTLTEAFLARIAALGETARLLLLTIALGDTGNRTIIFDAATRLDIPVETVDELETARLADVDHGSITIHHPLIRSAVLASSSIAERRRTHRALAGTYRAGGDLERAARHLAASTDAPDETVAAELEAAALLARRRGGYEPASHALEQAAALTPGADARERRLLSAAEDAWTAGLLDRARLLLDSIRSVAIDAPLRPDHVRLRAWIEMAEGSVPTAQEILWMGARDAAPNDPRLAGEMAVAAAETAWVQSDLDGLAEMASSLPSHTGVDGAASTYHQLLFSGLAAHAAGEPRRGIASLMEATRLAEQLDDIDLLNSAGHVAFYTGDDSAALRINARVAARSRADGSILRYVFALERQARAEILCGRWALATATLREVADLAESTGRSAPVAVTTAWEAYLAAVRGSDGFKRLITDAQDRATTSRLGVLRPLFDDVVAWAEAIHEATHDRYASSYQRISAVRHPAIRPMAAFDLVELAIRSGSQAEAVRTTAWVESLAAASGARWASSLASYGHALSSADEAEPQFQHALEMSSPDQRPFDVARIRLALGAQLRRSRQRMDARPHLEAAVASFEILGAEPWAERANQELRASGKTARRRDPSTVFDLTPQELQVARFVSEGLTNREVAERLFLSPRTVDYHLRKIFVKLGIGSRSQLARFSFD